MRWILIYFIIVSSTCVLAQEKFLELTLNAQNKGRSLKSFNVLVSCEEDVTFQLFSKKKKLSFYLAPGFNYKLIITKDGYYQSNYTLDLTDVPKAVYQDDFCEHTIAVKLVERSALQPTLVHELIYDVRTGKIKTKD